MQWLWESYQISTRLYAEAEQDSKFSEDYYKTHIAIIEQRIDQGGIRLAGMLNDIYGGKLFSYTFAPTELPREEKNNPDTDAQAGPVKVIDVKDAAGHLNENVKVTAKVYGTKDLDSMVLVNVGAAYPDSPLTIVLRNDPKSVHVDGKTITVTGKFVDYKGKPEIVVTDTSQLTVN